MPIGKLISIVSMTVSFLVLIPITNPVTELQTPVILEYAKGIINI